ncbi:MAG: hypothetical protein HOC38_05205, partial [Nitrosopumilus sp.]|nr:hypothetical protein [Nitrosopumilus sp.]
MKKLTIFVIFSFLMIFSLQQMTFAETENEEQRKKDTEKAVEKHKRKSTEKAVEEEEEVEKESEIRKIPSKLIKLLPTENKLEEITHRTIWKYVDKQSTLDEEIGIETVTALLRDISRVYDPIV